MREWRLPRHILSRFIASLCLSSLVAFGQQRESVVVTGTYQPIPLEEADRNVRVLNVRDLELVSNTFADLLKLDSSLDLRQRAPNGLQSDLSIRGGGFGQTLVLLDGLRLNDVQSGHHNLDLPVPLEAVSRIEILKGAGSTLYGSDAIGGVVNIITREPEAVEVRLRTAVGNFGVNQQRASVAFGAGRIRQRLTAARDFSSGFTANRDYRNLSFASQTTAEHSLGSTSIVLANNDRPFGAQNFYGNFNSWERTRTWFAAARQTLGPKTDAAFAYRRHTDLFVLYRDRPAVFTNRHESESLQASLRRREDVGVNARLHYGLDGYREAVASTNLRNHSRGRGAGFAALDVRALKRFSFSAGLREEFYGSGNHQLSPTVAAGVWLTPALKLRASASRAFRLPTYTDLYYQDPANLGSPDLRPEKAWSYEAGADWNAGGVFRAGATVFHRREQDVIDYIRRTPNDIWRATNFHKLRFTGVEATVGIRVSSSQMLELTYTGLRGGREALDGILSKYVFNYPIHTGIASWQGSLRGFIGRVRAGAVERLGRDPYAVVDLYAASSRGRIHPFVQLTNFSNTSYQEIPGVAMPGRAVVAGLELMVFSRK